MLRDLFMICLTCVALTTHARIVQVGHQHPVRTIKEGIALSEPGDTVIVAEGLYREGNIIIDKAITLIGVNYPVVDGEKQYEIFSIKAHGVVLAGFRVIGSGFSSLTDPGAIKVYDSNFVTIRDNILDDNYFGIYIQYGKHCIVRDNIVRAYGIEEQRIGNGIHCWKSDSLQIIGNTISGHRDGIYFEFVTNSVIWRNIAHDNLRYGLHFMFSNNDAYITNVFRNNGAGVAVMYTRNVKMFNNWFEDNWGDAAYGLLLKDISDSHIFNNRFVRNTSGVYMESSNRVHIEYNAFRDNGWGLKIQSNCMDNTITGNDFIGNTFDVSTTGSLVLNTFDGNFWDRFEGYDLDRDGTGDVPYRPLSIFAVIVEKNPSVMLLYRSFMITLLDKVEKMIPSLTPDNFIDNKPRMQAFGI